MPTSNHIIATSYGNIEYQLTRKKVKNINLRIADNGTVTVSAPMRLAQKHIDGFIQEKASWVFEHQQRVLARGPATPPSLSKQECLALFTKISDTIFPLFSDILNGEKPEIKVRFMKTRWGVCHITKKQITLNTRLADKPIEAIEYVVMHEYVHFIHADHQAGFHAEMARLMPDYKQRRKLLQ